VGTHRFGQVFNQDLAALAQPAVDGPRWGSADHHLAAGEILMM